MITAKCAYFYRQKHWRLLWAFQNLYAVNHRNNGKLTRTYSQCVLVERQWLTRIMHGTGIGSIFSSSSCYHFLWVNLFSMEMIFAMPSEISMRTRDWWEIKKSLIINSISILFYLRQSTTSIIKLFFSRNEWKAKNNFHIKLISFHSFYFLKKISNVTIVFLWALLPAINASLDSTNLYFNLKLNFKTSFYATQTSTSLCRHR